MPGPNTDALKSLIMLCLRGTPEAAAAVDALAAQRRELARALLAMEGGEEILATHLAAADLIGAQNLPCERSAEQMDLIHHVARRAAGATPPIHAILAAMILAPAHHFPDVFKLAALPDAVRVPYARYAMAAPLLFMEYGEADQFARHRLRAMERLYEAVFHDRLAEAHKIADVAAGASNAMLYFNSANLRPYFCRRAALLEWHLEQQRLDLHHLPLLTARPRVRIGILHDGFEPDPETYYLLGHLIGRPSAPEVILYLERDPAGPLAPRFTRAVDRIVTLPKSTATAAAQIRADDLDVLLISRNLTAVAPPALGLAAHRLARVQMVGTASPVTTGLSNIDIFLSGEMNDSAIDAPDHYEENLARLPGLATTYAYTYDSDPRTLSFSRAVFGISEAEVVFFSAANCFKIVPEVLQAWARILAGSPGSRLVLMPYNPNWFDVYAKSLFQRRIARQLAEQGVSPKRVLVLDPVPARADLHAALEMADIYLDSFPFAGACSLVDPLQVGLPIVAMDGATFRSAIAASILKASGLDHMVCADTDSYIARAVALAGDAKKRRREQDEVRQIEPSLLPCTWTAPLAQGFFDFAQDAVGAWRARVETLREMDRQQLQDQILILAETLRRQRNAGYLRFNDLALVTQCLYPCLSTLRAEGVPAGRIIDVGACVGEASLPFLRGGWRVDMFEPDPECFPNLKAICAAFPNARHLPVAVTGTPAGPAIFHKRRLGLSGIGESPYADQEKNIVVQTATLTATYETLRLQADLLKIDAEGLDLEILAGTDIESLAPKIVMLEFGAVFATQSPAAMRQAIDRMAEAGYGVAVFSNRQQDGTPDASWELDCLSFGDEPTAADAPSGNLVFFQADDTTFLTCLLLLLESFQPARLRQWGMRTG